MWNRLLACLLVLSAVGCKQGDPPPKKETGDIFFSGYYWNFKNSNENQVGPGPNKFASTPNNIWVDASGMLHLKITNVNNRWYCSELISARTMGYGTYIFTTASDLTTLNERVVLGLFTWNDYSFQTQANSEVDVEFSKWNNAADSFLLTYSVQPVWFSNPAPYPERTRHVAMQVSKLKNVCTHVMYWSPDIVRWDSYEGPNASGAKIASWSYDKNNIIRRKIEGSRTSNPVVIPAPEDSTHARMNLWLLNGLGPSNNKEVEVIIKSFNYIPL
jgi:hypothetical protein